jgi:fructuronate reductase
MTTIATATLPENVQLPQYDRSQLRSRIVHFGFGAFHRAHQALLTDRVLNASGGDWGICEISLFSGDRLMSQLRSRTTCLPCWKKAPTAISRLSSAPFTNA